MRNQGPGGRFTTEYEHSSILSGIDADLQLHVGQDLLWYRFDHSRTFDSVYGTVDDVYDVGGRQYFDPIVVPTVSAVIVQGMTVQNERGFYNSDTLRATLNIADVDQLLQDSLSSSLNSYLLDRIVYRDEVFTITKLYPRGLVKTNYTLLTLDANQVNPEQLVNDPQFQQYAN
jgi:hypothetical protein